MASRVFPVPGGPNRRIPLGGALIPVKTSGNCEGRITASRNIALALASPAISSQVMDREISIISVSIIASKGWSLLSFSTGLAAVGVDFVWTFGGKETEWGGELGNLYSSGRGGAGARMRTMGSILRTGVNWDLHCSAWARRLFIRDFDFTASESD